MRHAIHHTYILHESHVAAVKVMAQKLDISEAEVVRQAINNMTIEKGYTVVTTTKLVPISDLAEKALQ